MSRLSKDCPICFKKSEAATLENKIQSAFENKAEPEFIEKTIKSFIQTGLLDFTDNEKILYKVRSVIFIGLGQIENSETQTAQNMKLLYKACPA